MVDLQAGSVLDGLGEQLAAAERKRGVDFVAPKPGNRQVGVAWQAEQHGPAAARGNVQQHDRVGSLAADIMPGGELVFLLRCQPRAAVRAGDEPVLPGRGGRAAGVVHQDVGSDQLRVEIEVHPDGQHEDDDDEQGDDLHDPARAQPPLAGAGVAGCRSRGLARAGASPGARRGLLGPVTRCRTGSCRTGSRGGAPRGQAHGRLTADARRLAPGRPPLRIPEPLT